MEIPRLRLLMQGLHALESGDVVPQRIAQVGLARAMCEARSKRIGLTALEVAEKFMEYSNRRNAEREGILVIGLITAVEVEHVG